MTTWLCLASCSAIFPDHAGSHFNLPRVISSWQWKQQKMDLPGPELLGTSFGLDYFKGRLFVFWRDRVSSLVVYQ